MDVILWYSIKMVLVKCQYIMWMWYCDIQFKLLQYWSTLSKSSLFLMWYCDIVIFWQKNHDQISQYHTECDIVIFYQNGSSRMSQYHNITWMWYCDILLKLLEQYWSTLSKSTLFLTRKYPLRGYILGVLTHTTAWDRHWRGDETLWLI